MWSSKIVTNHFIRVNILKHLIAIWLIACSENDYFVILTHLSEEFRKKWPPLNVHLIGDSSMYDFEYGFVIEILIFFEFAMNQSLIQVQHQSLFFDNQAFWSLSQFVRVIDSIFQSWVAIPEESNALFHILLYIIYHFFFYLAAYFFAISSFLRALTFLYFLPFFLRWNLACSLLGLALAPLFTLSEFFLISSWTFLYRSYTLFTPAYKIIKIF